MAEEVVPGDLEIADELIAERRTEKPGETPEDMTPWQRPITGWIDLINDWAGKILCLLMVPLIGVVVIEVFSRNAFGIMAGYGWDDTARALGLGPTMFAYDISRMISGVLFMGAAGYGLMRGVHIRADFLYRGWSNKTQANSLQKYGSHKKTLLTSQFRFGPVLRRQMLAWVKPTLTL